MNSVCKICSHPNTAFDQALVLQKYSVTYFCCTQCGFVQTDEPFWLDEAYQSAITTIDIGPVSRSYIAATLSRALLLLGFNPKAKCVDYGAGYGIFVRRMRDLGFDFRHHDKFCDNIFAKQFEVNIEDEIGHSRYELLTAFEVFEHLPDPIKTMEQMLKVTDSIFFSTTLLPEGPTPKISAWAYYLPNYGQHVALYSRGALQSMANKFNLTLHTDGASYHLLTRKKIQPFQFKLATRQLSAQLLGIVLSRLKHHTSLIDHDIALIEQQAQSSISGQ